MREADLSLVYENEQESHLQPWSLNTLRECVASKYVCFVAIKNERIVGHIIFSSVLDEGHLLNVCVSKGDQSSGIGKQLIDHGIDCLAKSGVTQIFLEVRRTNIKAICLYQWLGFKQIGVRVGYYKGPASKEDALVFGLSPIVASDLEISW